MMTKLKPVHIDGVLYGLIALCGYLAGALGGDSAAALFTSMSLWLLQTLNGCILATATALKMFRSTTYAKHQDDTVNGKGDLVQKKESQEITIAPDQSVQKVTKTEAVVESPPK